MNITIVNVYGDDCHWCWKVGMNTGAEPTRLQIFGEVLATVGSVLDQQLRTFNTKLKNLIHI
jgi:hypothetical protein